MKNYNINEIQALTEVEAKTLAIETAEIKGYNIYFVNLGEYFGYSYLVFKNEHHIHYANNYQLHNEYLFKESGIEGLRTRYYEEIKNKLFTEEEIKESLKSYDDYQSKSYFLMNYYPMQVDYISPYALGFNPTKEEEKAFEKKISEMTFNKVSRSYMDDKDFIKHHYELYFDLCKQKANVKDNYDYQKSAFLYEMANHEYHINWQADYDTLSAFGKITYQPDYAEDLNKYFDELRFTETQRRAYMDARAQFLKEAA